MKQVIKYSMSIGFIISLLLIISAFFINIIPCYRWSSSNSGMEDFGPRESLCRLSSNDATPANSYFPIPRSFVGRYSSFSGITESPLLGGLIFFIISFTLLTLISFIILLILFIFRRNNH